MMYDTVPERGRRHETFLRLVDAKVAAPNRPDRGEGM